MAAPLQVAFADDSFSSGTTVTTPALAANATVGSVLEVWTTVSANVLPTSVIDSAGQHYTNKDSQLNFSSGQNLALYVFASNASATKLTVTATYGSAQAGKGIVLNELPGSAYGTFDKSNLKETDTPGTGANAVTNTAVTPTNAGALVSAIAMETAIGDGSDLAAGTGYTLGSAIWTFGGSAALAKTEYRTLSGTPSTAATETAATHGGSGFYLVGAAFYSPAAGGASGSGAITEGADSAVGTGTQATPGSGASTEAHDSVSGTGAQSTSGSGASTEAHDTVSGTGASGAGGSGAVTQASDVAAGTGSQSTSGSGASTQASDVASGVGTTGASGSGAVTEGHDTVAGSGILATTLTQWLAVLAAVKAGSRKARVLVIGDSLTAGENSTGAAMGSNAHSLSFPVQMAPLFLGAPAHQDSWFSNNNAASDGNTLDQYDFRITLGSGWVADTSNPTLAGYPIKQGSATSSSLAFTPLNSLDNFTIWFEKFSGSPQYTVNVDGGSSLGTLAMNASAGIGFANFTVPAGTHTINVVSNGTSGGKIFGCEAWLSTAPQIQIFTAGGDSWTAGDWTQNNGNAWDPLAMAEFLAPDLSIVCLGKNEQAQGISQATFEANLRILVAGLLNAGSAVLIWGPPLSLPSGLPTNMTEAAQLAYETNMANVATSFGCTFYSLTQNRANWGSFAAANAAGFMYTGDNIHLTPAGYLDVAKALLMLVDSAVGTISEGHDAVSGAGAQSTSATGAPSEGHDTVAGNGAQSISGSGTSTEAHDTAAGVGSQSISGSGTPAESPDTVSGTGASGSGGIGSAQEGADVAAGSGSQSTSGGGAVAQPADAAAGTGAQSISGSGATTDAADIASGVGASGAVGAGAVTEPHDTALGSGTASTSASGSVTESADVLTGIGGGGTPVFLTGTRGYIIFATPKAFRIADRRNFKVSSRV